MIRVDAFVKIQLKVTEKSHDEHLLIPMKHAT